MIALHLEFALLITAIIFLFIFALSRWYFGITNWSSLAVALAVAIVLLAVIFPMSSVYQVRRKKLLLGIYLIFYLFAFIVLITYIIDKASHDRIPLHILAKDQMCRWEGAPMATRSMTDTIVF